MNKFLVPGNLIITQYLFISFKNNKNKLEGTFRPPYFQ